MDKILFSELIAKFFPKFDTLVETYNGRKNAPTYLFKTMLTPKFSVSQTWESGSIRNSIVAADVVAMDSNLPLKKRDKISTANGELPKLGMKMQLKESEINELNILASKGDRANEITKRLLNDAVKCANGVDERLEFLFLQALSNGMCVVADDYNTGVGIRINFGYKSENKAAAVRSWSDVVNATPISDINRMIAKASDNGDVITTIVMAKETYDLMRASQEAKEFVANYNGVAVVGGNKLPTPTDTAFREALRSESNVEVIIINRSVRIEKNGVQTPVKPYNRDKVVFLTEDMVGELVYGQLAEETNPSEGAMYTKANDYTLIKKYHIEEPFSEMTSSQAIALPVLNNVESIYQLDINELAMVDDPSEVEGDANIKLFGATYTKASVIAALNDMGIRTATTISDVKLKEKVNGLTEDKINELKSKLA